MEDIATFLCFRLGALSRRIYRHYNTLYSCYGITVTQSFILFDLLLHKSSNMKDIASRVQLDSPAITGLVDRLAKENLVERKKDPSDRRGLLVGLTTKGRKLAKELAPVAEEFNTKMHAILIPEDIAVFERSLDRLEKGLKENNPERQTEVLHG
jgi:DNA-binding MarR family transcriptional regulator